MAKAEMPFLTKRALYLPLPVESPTVALREIDMLSSAPEYLKAGTKGR
jgi:hypothetical protein